MSRMPQLSWMLHIYDPGAKIYQFQSSAEEFVFD